MAVVALSGRNDPTEDLFHTAIPALTEGTVCPGIVTYSQGKNTSIGKSRFIDCWINCCIEGHC
jgi:hypothetical protein